MSDHDSPSGLPGLLELATALLGTVLLGGIRHARNRSLLPGILAALGLALLVYFARLLFRRFKPEEGFLAGFPIAGLLLAATAGTFYALTPRQVDVAALIEDLEVQQIVGMMGRKLPDMDLESSRYGEARPLAAYIHDQAARTRDLSEKVRLSIEGMGQPLSESEITDPAKRSANLAKLDAIQPQLAALSQEADLLAGHALEAKVQAMTLPAELKSSFLDSVRQNSEFTGCRRFVEVQGLILGVVRQALALADRHLLTRPGQRPVFDGPASLEAYKRLVTQLQNLAAENDSLVESTKIYFTDVKR